MASKYFRTSTRCGAAMICVSACMNIGCGSADDLIPQDLAVALRGAETVYFADGQAWERISGRRSGTKALRLLESPLFGLVEILSEAGLAIKERGAIDHVIISARNFRMPANLGPVMADTLYSIRLRDPGSIRFADKYRCTKCSQVSGDVWQWDVVLERGVTPTRVFATRTAGVLLIATRFELIAEATSPVPRGADLAGARKLMANLADSRRIWGARLYGARRYEDGLSAGLRLGNYEVGHGAKCTLFELNGTRLSIRYYTDSDDGGPLRFFEGHGRSVKVIHPGIWEAKLNLGDNESDVGDALAVLGLFGFGVYL